MPVPSFDQFLSPLLHQLAAHVDGLATADAVEATANAVDLSPADRKLLLPSGTQSTYRNRICWAHDRLKRAGLSSSAKRGVWKLTAAGVALAANHPSGLPESELERILETPTDAPLSGEPDELAEEPDARSIPEERLASIYRNPAHRATCLAFFAELIEIAHGYGPGDHRPQAHQPDGELRAA